jgi:hypothetical protein
VSQDQTLSELAARIADLSERQGLLDEYEQRLLAELVELYERVKKLRQQPPEAPGKPNGPS